MGVFGPHIFLLFGEFVQEKLYLGFAFFSVLLSRFLRLCETK